MDETGDHHAMWNKWGPESQGLSIFSCMWKLERKRKKKELKKESHKNRGNTNGG